MDDDLEWVTGRPARAMLWSAAQPAAWLSHLRVAADAGALARSLAVLDTFRRSLPFAHLDPLGALGRQVYDAGDTDSEMAGTVERERRRSAAGPARIAAASTVEVVHGSSVRRAEPWPRSPGQGSPAPLPGTPATTLHAAQLEALAFRRGSPVAGGSLTSRGGTPAYGDPAGGALQARDGAGVTGAAHDPAQPRRATAAIPAGAGLLRRLVEPAIAEGVNANPGEPAGQAALVRAAITRALDTAVAAGQAITSPSAAIPGPHNVPWIAGDGPAGRHRSDQGTAGGATAVVPDWPGAPPQGASPAIAGNGPQVGAATPVEHDLRVPFGQRPAPPGLSLLAEILDVFQTRQTAGPPAAPLDPVVPDAVGAGGEAPLAPSSTQEMTAVPAAPGAAAIQNTFNVTVHMAGGTDAGEEMLAERLTRILIDQARRQGIDI